MSRDASALCRVLLVDDDAVGAMALRRYLEFDDIEVTVVATAEEALSAMAAVLFDDVVTDLRLPGLSGQAMACRLRQPRLIALSGDVAALDGAVYFDRRMRKPCQPEVLLKAILGHDSQTDTNGRSDQR